MKIQGFRLLIAQSKEVVVFFLVEHGASMQQQHIPTVTWMMLFFLWDGAIGVIHLDKGIIPITNSHLNDIKCYLIRKSLQMFFLLNVTRECFIKSLILVS